MTTVTAIQLSGDARPSRPERGRSDGDGEWAARLPIPVGPVAEPQPDHDRRAAASGGLRILVVDDSPDTAKMLSLLLGRWGYEVRTAHDGLEALDVAADFRPAVVLLDIGMPRLNGYDTARRMREQPWGTAAVLVALTGWSQGESQRRSREAGFDHHLVKPADPSELQALLAGLGGGRLRDGAARRCASSPQPKG